MPLSDIELDPIEFALEHIDVFKTDGLSAECRMFLRKQLSLHAIPAKKTVVLSENEAVRNCMGGERAVLMISGTEPTNAEPAVTVTPQGDTLKVRISRFDKTTEGLFMQLVRISGVCILDIDLEDNYGGYIDVAKRTLEHLAPRAGMPVITTVSFRGGKNEIKTDGGEGEKYMPPCLTIIIRVNGGTASSAEIFAAVLRDWYPDRVQLQGSKTLGKDEYQAAHDDHIFALVPVGRWFVGIGEKRYSVKGGLKPDIEVPHASMVGQAQ